MRRTTGEECESLSMKAWDKPVSSGGKKLTSSSWMKAQGLKHDTSNCEHAEASRKSQVSLGSTLGEAVN